MSFSVERAAFTLSILGILLISSCAYIPAELPVLTPTLTPAQPSQSTVGGDCPVSLPNATESPSEHFMPVEEAIQNPTGTLFALPWSDGKVIFSPNGPGQIHPDGSLSMKWPWYSTVEGELAVDGKRLDAPTPPTPQLSLSGNSTNGYVDAGFHPAIITFPTEGCWEVTIEVGSHSLTFITLVVRLRE